MRFTVEQDLSASLDAVVEAVIDPAFIARLAELPKLGKPELLAQRQEGPLVHQRVRYAFVGDLSAAVRAVVDPDRLTWVEDSTHDRDRHVASFRILPDHYANLLRCRGTFELTETARGCRRIATGEVTVTVPLVGRRVEAAIVSGLEEHAEREAAVLESWLNGRIDH